MRHTIDELQNREHAAVLAAWRVETQKVRDCIQKTLEQYGWVVATGSAIAQKTFLTAVGEKVAHAYLSNGDSFNRTLFATYESEGRNVLEPHAVLISQELRAELVNHRINQFANSVDTVVSNTYAVRLLYPCVKS